MSLLRILFSVSTSHSAILVSCDFILVTSFPAAPLTSQPHRSPPPLGTQSTNRTTTSPAEATTGEIQQLLRPLLPLIIGYFVQTQIKVLNLSALTFRVHRCDHRVAYQSLSAVKNHRRPHCLHRNTASRHSKSQVMIQRSLQNHTVY